MPKKNEAEKVFTEILKELPAIKDERELLDALAEVSSKMSEILIKLGKPEHLAITAVAAYFGLITTVYLGGCKDMEMASLSAKTQMIEKFEVMFDD